MTHLRRLQDAAAAARRLRDWLEGEERKAQARLVQIREELGDAEEKLGDAETELNRARAPMLRTVA